MDVFIRLAITSVYRDRRKYMPSNSLYGNSKGLDPVNKATATTARGRTLHTLAINLKLHLPIKRDVSVYIL